jgi:hypothetical protein
VTIKKESDEKSEEETSSDTMSFPTGKDFQKVLAVLKFKLSIDTP